MKAKGRHPHGRSPAIGKRVAAYVLLSVICLAGFPQILATSSFAPSDRLDLSASLIAQDRLFCPAVFTNGLRKTNLSFQCFQYGAVSDFDVLNAFPLIARPAGLPQSGIPASRHAASGIRVRAPPQSPLFQQGV